MSEPASGATAQTDRGPQNGPPVVARRAGFSRDLLSVASRALRQIPREPEAIIPALIIPLSFFVVNVGALSAVAGVSRAGALSVAVLILGFAIGVSGSRGVSRRRWCSCCWPACGGWPSPGS